GIAIATGSKVFAQAFKMIADNFRAETDNNDNNDDDDDDDDEKKENYPVNKYSHKNFIYVAANRSIICVHPAFPSFEYLYVANLNDYEDEMPIFVPSLQYGVFFLSADRQRLLQSPDLSDSTKVVLLDVSSDTFANPNSSNLSLGSFRTEHLFSTLFMWSLFDIIPSPPFLLLLLSLVMNLEYDESFGISGRLIVYGRHKNNQLAFVQFFNVDELKPLMD
ncbi:hypothetical protein RFI_16123, partial [Reticulomyxa filosa]